MHQLKQERIALPALGSDKARKLFSDYGVLGESELDARLMVLFEPYVNVMEIEARTLSVRALYLPCNPCLLALLACSLSARRSSTRNTADVVHGGTTDVPPSPPRRSVRVD